VCSYVFSSQVGRVCIVTRCTIYMSNFVSRDYWENRYRHGGTSGAGSYNHLAHFKANVINWVFRELGIGSVIDFGMGDGNQLGILNILESHVTYTGIDVSPKAIEICRAKYPGLRFMLDTEAASMALSADMVMSCDVIYNLIEDSVYTRYMDAMFKMADKYVLIYALDADINHAAHVRFRKFTTYIASTHPDWALCSHIPQMYPQKVLGKNNDSTSTSDFYIFAKKAISPPPPLVRRGRALITGTWGRRTANGMVLELMKTYAHRVHADFYNMNDHDMHYIRHSRPDYAGFLNGVRVGRGNNIAYAFKVIAIHHMLQQYESVLWLDNSCIVDPERCDDLFDKYNSSVCDVAAYNEGENRELRSFQFDANFLRQKRNGFALDTSRYINTGVLLCHSSFLENLNMASLMEHSDLFASNYPTQAPINYIIQSSRVHTLACMEPRFNTLFVDCKYNDAGRNKSAADIPDAYLQSANVGIFHITGFYRNRDSIIHRIARFMLPKLTTISMTSWPKRLHTAHLALRSILNQSPVPHSIILWLASDEIPDDHPLPTTLQEVIALSRGVIQVRYVSHNIRSYLKLVPALLAPELRHHRIVTVDDDIIHPQGWLAALLDSHAEHPNCIVAHRARQVRFPHPYLSWPVSKTYTKSDAKQLLPTGVGGVLYPPGALHSNVTDMELAMRLAPTADDLFFWIHAVLNRTDVVLTKRPIINIKELPGASASGLARINCVGGQNDVIVRKLLEHYGSIRLS
jgi:hypothetical protein